MSIRKLGRILSTWLLRRISTLTIFVTDRCNARCAFCFNWRAIEGPGRGDLLTVDEYSRIAAGIGRLPTLIVSGGEPFLRADLPEIVSNFVRLAGTQHVSIPTNCFPETVADSVERIVSTHPNALVRLLVGIDGLGEEHDRQRGLPGGFELMEANADRLLLLAGRYPNLSVNAVTVFHAGNKDRIREIADWVHSKGFYEHKLQFIRGDFKDQDLAEDDADAFSEAVEYTFSLFHQRHTGSDNNAGLYSDIFSAVNRFSRRLVIRRKKEQRIVIRCMAGHRIMVVRETGDVYPCELQDRRLGNLRDIDFHWQRLLRSKERRETLRWIRKSCCWCTTECNAVLDSVYNPVAWIGIAREWLFSGKSKSSDRLRSTDS